MSGSDTDLRLFQHAALVNLYAATNVSVASVAQSGNQKLRVYHAGVYIQNPYSVFGSTEQQGVGISDSHGHQRGTTLYGAILAVSGCFVEKKDIASYLGTYFWHPCNVTLTKTHLCFVEIY